MEYGIKIWTDFFVLMGGAAATLTGLIFVGISISLTKILSIPKLPARAAQALVLLLTVLLASALFLVPGGSLNILGVELLLIGIIVWGITFRADIRILRRTDALYKRQYLLNALFNQFSVLPYIISGIIILTGNANGLYWLVPGILFSFIKAVIDAWVLLIEINR